MQCILKILIIKALKVNRKFWKSIEFLAWRNYIVNSRSVLSLSFDSYRAGAHTYNFLMAFSYLKGHKRGAKDKLGIIFFSVGMNSKAMKYKFKKNKEERITNEKNLNAKNEYFKFKLLFILQIYLIFRLIDLFDIIFGNWKFFILLFCYYFLG